MLYVPGNIVFEKLRQLVKRRLQDTQVAYLGDGAGVVDILDRPGYVYARYYEGKDTNGNDRYSPPFPVRSAGAAFLVYEGCPVNVKYGKNNELEIDSAVFQALDRAGVDTRLLNPLHPQSRWVYLWQITIGLATATATTTTDSFLVSVKKHLTYVNNVFRYFETGEAADKFNLAAYNPAADQHRYVIVWQDVYGQVGETTASTSQSLFMPLSIEDANEATLQRPPDAIPYKAFVLANNGGTLTQNVQEVDTRQFLNTAHVWGFPNPVAYRERIHPDRQVIVAGPLVVTGSLEVLGSLIGVPTVSGSGSGSSGITQLTGDVTAGPGSGSQVATLATVNGNVGSFTNTSVTVNGKGLVTAAASGATPAPVGATYIVQTSDATLTNEQVMGALATGLVKNTTTTGVQSIAVAGTDYVIPATVEALTWKNAVRFATAAALAANTYNNGTSGVGATLTANANGALSVDGTSVAAGNRILVKNEATQANNGIYVVTQVGSAGTPYILTRTTDFDAGSEVPGTVVFVLDGFTLLRSTWRVDSTSAPTIGTSAMTFTRFDGANTTLSNLGATAVNTDLVADSDDLRDLGTSVNKWREIFSSLYTMEERSTPSTPASSDYSIYAKAVGGVGQLFGINDGGSDRQVSPSYAILIDSKATTTAGGTSANTTWNARNLNTEQYDPDGLATISSNKFVPLAGTYRVQIYAPFVGGSAALTRARNRLFNVTAATSVEEGSGVFAAANNSGVVILDCVFTANGSDEYRVDTYTSVGRATDGLGFAVSDGSAETYTVVVLKKIA